MHHKSIIWHNASKLKLNLSIVTHGLRATETSFTPPDTAPARKTPDVGGLYCFHVAINSARAVLETFLSTSAKAVVFSSGQLAAVLGYNMILSISLDMGQTLFSICFSTPRSSFGLLAQIRTGLLWAQRRQKIARD